jgi:hypothetical protein
MFYFVEPDITCSDAVEQLFFEVTGFPPLGSDVDASFDPGEFLPTARYKVESIRVVEIKMKNNRAITVGATSAEYFI